MTKKVGVLTFFRSINNGAVLQATALSNIVLKKLGYEAELINYRLPRVERYRSSLPFCYLENEKNVLGKAKRFIRICLDYKKNKTQNGYFDGFVNKYLHTTKTYFNYDELKKDCTQFDKYIVGSDMVWNPLMTDGVDPAFYLTFVEKSKTKIAYAASIGTLDLNKNDLNEMVSLINKMDYVSLREESSVVQLKKYTDKQIISVLDPTLLTHINDWKDYYDSKPLIDGDYIFAFNLEENPLLYKEVNYLAKTNNLKIVAYDGTNNFISDKGVIEVRYCSGPSEFLNYIKNAKIVVTNSFHGCAFSIIFEKEFYCIPHTSRGSRMRDLLKALEIDRIIDNELLVEKDCKPIDYYKVDELRDNLIDKSLNFLIEALK